MKRVIKLIPVLLLIAVFMVSCNLPFSGSKQPTAEVAPNLTLTALFDTSMNIPPTVTPLPAATNTSIPTSVPATTIPTIVPTATLVPPTATVIVPTTANSTSTVSVTQRGGTQMTANFLTTAPVMDGTYAEWVDKTSKYALPYVVWGPKNWKDAADLEGVYAAAWDATYLYLSVKVTDDVFVQNKSGAKLYLGDSIEILLDTNLLGDFNVQSIDGDDFQFGISPGNPAKGISKEAYLWYPSNYAGTKSTVLVSSLFETGPIYRVEIGIPWSMLGVTPVKGMRLGFAVSVSDNDNTTADVQDTMISTAKNRNFLNPTTWGELVLQK